MARAALEHAFSASHLDRVFRENAQRQREGDLPFSLVVDVMSLAVLQIRPSVCAAYKDKKAELGVSINSVYNKLSGIEPHVTRAMVRDSAARLARTQEAMGHESWTVLSGYRTRIIDGKHLNRTERRLQPLRELNAAPLPGQVLAVLDADRRLVCDVIPCEDAHAQERSLLGEVLQTVQEDDLWIADRNFCTAGFLTGIARRKARFIVRRHRQMPLETVGRRRRVGKSSTGTIYEQAARLRYGDNEIPVRLITVKLKHPTRDGETEITLVSNLPKKVSARRIARLYRDRWTIETAFQQVATALHGEIDSLAYPKAALFGFCIALVAHNLLNVIKAAIATAHDEDPRELSTYYLADEISTTYHGMMIVLPPEFWRRRFGALNDSEMAARMLQLAQQVDWSRFRKHRRGPKRPPPDVGTKTNRNHVSTKRVLEQYYNSHC
jgi:IS4 transposase